MLERTAAIDRLCDGSFRCEYAVPVIAYGIMVAQHTVGLLQGADQMDALAGRAQ